MCEVDLENKIYDIREGQKGTAYADLKGDIWNDIECSDMVLFVLYNNIRFEFRT